MDKITGMACRTNRTLSFLAMDSYHYKLLAERLGVTLDRKNRYSAAVIVNGQVRRMDRSGEALYTFF